jgi:dihydropyrimidinase
LKEGTIQVVATDHCSFNYHGDKQLGRDDFTKCPNGAPGVETRMPILFSEGVGKGRLTLNEFAAVTSTNPARLFGMYPKKGVLAPGSDADIVLIDPDMDVTITKNILHENVDYTPYEGMKVKGWPVMTIIRGQVVVRDERLQVMPGFGRFVRRETTDYDSLR